MTFKFKVNEHSNYNEKFKIKKKVNFFKSLLFIIKIYRKGIIYLKG